MPSIYGVSPSPFVRKVRVVMAEKSLPYDMKPQPPFNQPPEFFEISPLGKIPVYEDGDFTLPDSSAICAYLERTQPKPPLYPSDAKEFARALWYEEYADSKVADTAGPVFFERVVKPRFFNQEPDKERVEKHLRELLPPVLDYLEKALGSQEYFVGGRFSIADIALGSMFQNLKHGGESIDASRWPKLAAWVERVHSRPSFKACWEEETQFFKG